MAYLFNQTNLHVMKPRLLVFDLDGTLIQTMDDYADKAARLIFEHYDMPQTTARRRYFDTSGLPFEKQLAEIFPGDERNDVVAELFEEWKNPYLTHVRLSSETEKLLITWRDSGMPLAISSNNLDSYVKRISKNWPIELALGYQRDEQMSKGAAHFSLLERHFGLTRQEMLFIGDSPNDARIASRENVPFLALLTTAFGRNSFTDIANDMSCITHLSEINECL